MADIVMGCSEINVIKIAIPRFVVAPPSGQLTVTVNNPNTNIVIKNPTITVKTVRPDTSTHLVLPIAGPPGSGGSGTDFYYAHNQVLPSAGWSVIHNLGKFPNVAVIIGGETIGVAVQHLDANSLYIPFAIPVSGKAICS